jgi:hypothetical protein
MVASSITVQNSADSGLNYTNQACAAGLADAFINDGKTVLLFANANASARTLTITKQNKAPSAQGFNPITLTDTTVTIPGSGTNGGLCVVGPFAQLEYNDGSGLVQLAYSAVTTLTVAAVSIPRV